MLSGSGLERLVELSVCKKARLDSDSTLVAVITAVSISHNFYAIYAISGIEMTLFEFLIWSSHEKDVNFY